MDSDSEEEWRKIAEESRIDSENDDPVEIAKKIAKSKEQEYEMRIQGERQVEQQEYERMIQEEEEHEIIQKQQRKKEREQEREYEKERQRKLDKSIKDDELKKRLFGSDSDSDDEPVEIANELSEDLGWDELISLLTTESDISDDSDGIPINFSEKSTGVNTSDEDLQEFIYDVIREKNEKKEKIYTTKEYKKKKEKNKNRIERRKQLSYINATEQELDVDVNIDDVKNKLNLIAGLFYDAKNKFKETPKTEEKKYIRRKIKMNNAKIRFDLAKEDLRAYKNLKKNRPYEFSGTPL
jgi:hypothetical protein